MMRDYLLSTIGWAFSFTVLLLIYVWIKQSKFQDFGEWMYPKADYKNHEEIEMIFNSYIRGFYYWLPVTLAVDIGIRKLIRKFKK